MITLNNKFDALVRCNLVVTAIAIGAVALGAGIYSAVARKDAADKAADAQKAAIKKQNKLLNQLDPDALNDLAKRFDKDRVQGRLDLQKEIEPEVAQLRELSKKQLLEAAQQPKSQQQSQQLANTLFNETKVEDPRIKALKDSILLNAQEDLKAGATLPPEFQAELVRSGLETGGQSGIGFDRNAIGGGTARLLGAAGIALEAQRKQQAAQEIATAQELTNSRVNILATVFPRLRDLEISQRNEAVGNLQLSDALLPEYGLSGKDAVNAQIAKVNAKSGLVRQRGQVKANQAVAEGEFNAGIANSVSSAVSTGAGAYMGGMGGGGNPGLSYGGTNGVGSYVNSNPTGNYGAYTAYLGGYQSPQTGAYSGYGIRY